ncbi:uncharacterized protein LOC114252585 [Bombyx mandarina]|uniref:Uncharacterized protein LOC114252585 n=1 Tax=Bombyx mandarina TaxID=7092 RepID=A0A6J2KPM7_BOMMA|nr:uncharacterized protein LOC114252585 [Bombyx mandarina]
MKRQIYIFVLVLIFATCTDLTKRDKFRKRNTIIKANGNFTPRCPYDNTVLRHNNDTLRQLVVSSKYIFTGKISSVQKRKRGKVKGSVFKVYIRRVLKGDVDFLSDILNFETRTFNSSNRAYILAESRSLKPRCAGVVRRGAALFFSREFSYPLKLLVDPVPSNIDTVRKIKSIIKGMVFTRTGEISL